MNMAGFSPVSYCTPFNSVSGCPATGHIIDSSQVICEKVEKSDISDIDKKKYLVPAVSPLYCAAFIPIPLAQHRSYRSRLVRCLLFVIS
jgi:hypothetical protein